MIRIKEVTMKKTVALLVAFVMLFTIVSCTRGEVDNTISFDNKNSKIIAHRGLSGLEIENTEEAFSAAGERSYYGIEADVRKTGDGQFIICHDKTLTRISKSNLNVEKSTLEELLEVTLSVAGKNGEGKLCELSTYISICKAYEKHAILELKSDFNEQDIGRIIDIVSSYDYLENTTFISFNYTNLEYVRKILPSQSAQYLFSKIDDEIIDRLIADKVDVAISYKILTEDYLRLFHDAGLRVNCWTVDDVEIAERLASLGVDYITTNILE